MFKEADSERNIQANKESLKEMEIEREREQMSKKECERERERELAQAEPGAGCVDTEECGANRNNRARGGVNGWSDPGGGEEC